MGFDQLGELSHCWGLVRGEIKKRLTEVDLAGLLVKVGNGLITNRDSMLNSVPSVSPLKIPVDTIADLCHIQGSPWGPVAIEAVSVETSAALASSSQLNNREDGGEERRVFLCLKGGAGTQGHCHSCAMDCHCDLGEET